MTTASRKGYLFKRFFLAFVLLFSFLYFGKVVSHSIASHRVRYEEYYLRSYSAGPFHIESRGVHGSGADLDGFYANVSYRGTPLPIRFTDYDPKANDREIEFFLLGLACLSLALIVAIPAIAFKILRAFGMLDGWTFDAEPVFVIAGFGLGFCLVVMIPILSFGWPYVNVFVAG